MKIIVAFFLTLSLPLIAQTNTAPWPIPITPASGGPLTAGTIGNLMNLQKTSNVAYAFGDSYCKVGVLDQTTSLCGLVRRDIPAYVYDDTSPGSTLPEYIVEAYAKYLPGNTFPTVSIITGSENDASNDACSACANAITHYKNSVSALVSWLTIPFTNRQMASVAASTGTWTAEINVPLSANYQFSNPGTAMSCTVSGCTRTFTITTTTATTRLGINYNICNFGAGGCGSFTVNIDGTNVTDNCSGTTTFTSYSCVAFSLSQIEGIYRQEYTVSAATSHTIIFTSTANGFVVPNAVDWIVPNATTNNIVYGFTTNAAWTNYAAYNTAETAVFSQFVTDGIPAYLADVVGGVVVAGTTYTVNATSDLSTTPTQTVSGSNLANHPNTAGAEHMREVFQAEQYVSGVVVGSPNINAPTMGPKFLGPVKYALSVNNNGILTTITAAATISLTGTSALGGEYAITGATPVTTITAPEACLESLTGTEYNFRAVTTAVTFGTGGNISAGVTVPVGHMVTMVCEQQNPISTTPKWYPTAANDLIWTATNCTSSASPAVCGSSAAGSVLIPTGTTSSTLTVNTTAVTANSQIFFYPDDSLGTKLSTTCNSTLATLAGGSFISARAAGTSFQITFNGSIVTNGVCGSFLVVN